MLDAIQILQKYWKHDRFRKPQEQIIQSVLDGQDTFALMPTGGGKSICFQVPAMMQPGMALVISPLVALMKDQIDNLQKIDIKAISITGGLSTDEISDLLDNCQFGNYKFLYVSPERLQSDWILERIKNLRINLIAIDEAHCVSQWGHDFRPAYLKIATLKTLFPKVPFIALTASATPRVQEDIIEQLKLNKPIVFKKSFARENLAYMVYPTEDKLFLLGQILQKNPEPSIIYVRNRKSCVDTAAQLNAMGYRAVYYHGGLSRKDKEQNMNRWMDESTQVMVATNAFGMGIDKANVKTVVHIQLPDNLENYYQEAGRAGRNNQKAFAVLLTATSEIQTAKQQLLAMLPDKKFLLQVYLKLCSYFQVAYGEGIGEVFAFSLNTFCTKYNFPILKTYQALQFLDRQGVIGLSQEFSEKITLQFLIESREVIRYMSLNPADEEILLTILRTYPGVYDLPTALNPALIAKKSGAPESDVLALLEKWHKREMISLQSKNNDTQLIFHEIREDEKTINRVSRFLEMQNQRKIEQLDAVLAYATNHQHCKSEQLLEYFGEKGSQSCGMCSYCIQQKKGMDQEPNLTREILELLKSEKLSSRELQNRLGYEANDIIFALQTLLENEIISVQANSQYTLNK
ncbi:RecQ family ATP-dependent DNA helicase [Flavobacterium sp. CYK-55]|uniref:RecQ family ATP-dependent DNA helicase n=1 Tax=Flavobacterium sp. CYK-55 TaxID=2835529 RepID=UPI001BCE737D|nr:ATP-dependent DNA helicase RecQ [Flavobacterium sp. CYK-55]MBS7787479.1 RecQ family ATP-dependent DNA helicase [Flavobacterium sp. CYK-55]